VTYEDLAGRELTDDLFSTLVITRCPKTAAKFSPPSTQRQLVPVENCRLSRWYQLPFPVRARWLL